MINIDKIIVENGIDPSKLRLNIGSGNVRYSNCLNIELEPHEDVDADIYGDITKGLDLPSGSFNEILMIHVIEHIDRRKHQFVLDEIWRLLVEDGRLIMGFPDFIECAKRFIDNKYGARWTFYHDTIFGRRSRNGDAHVTAIEQQDFTDKLISSGFNNIKWLKKSINVTVVAHKCNKPQFYI